MTADAYFAIGRTHDVCQDYALASDDVPKTWALVSDGCSSSPASDIGARLLGRAAAHALERGRLAPTQVIAKAARMVDALGMARSCLDATLAWVVRDEGITTATIIGDGVVAARRCDGGIDAWVVTDRDGAPAYPSYLLDRERLGDYLSQHGRRIVKRYRDGVLVDVGHEHLRAAPYSLQLTLEAHPVVVVLSDGVTSFQKDGEPVAVTEVLERLLAVKTSRGRFMARRCRRFLRREAPALGWRHDDDLAAAAIWHPRRETAA